MPSEKVSSVYSYDGQTIWASKQVPLYEVGNFLGGGAAGTVYEAENVKSREHYAIKILNPLGYKMLSPALLRRCTVVAKGKTILDKSDEGITEEHVWWLLNGSTKQYLAACFSDKHGLRELSLNQCVQIWGTDPKKLQQPKNHEPSAVTSPAMKMASGASPAAAGIPVVPSKFAEFILKRDHIFREIKNMRKISTHRNVIRLEDVLELIQDSKCTIFLVMELANGGELFDRIKIDCGTREDAARQFFQQLLDGVRHCHEQGVCHRDLKPENLLLSDNVPGFLGTILKIADFGFSARIAMDTYDAALMSQQQHMDSNVGGGNGGGGALVTPTSTPGKAVSGSNPATTAGTGGSPRTSESPLRMLKSIVGSPFYVAPEVVQAAAGYDGVKADVWSLGVILYAMLAGNLPFLQDLSTCKRFRSFVKWVADAQAGCKTPELFWMEDAKPALEYPTWLFPSKFSNAAKSLIVMMLHPDPLKRFSVLQAQNHPWVSPTPPPPPPAATATAPHVPPVVTASVMSRSNSTAPDQQQHPNPRQMDRDGDCNHPGGDVVETSALATHSAPDIITIPNGDVTLVEEEVVVNIDGTPLIAVFASENNVDTIEKVRDDSVLEFSADGAAVAIDPRGQPHNPSQQQQQQQESFAHATGSRPPSCHVVTSPPTAPGTWVHTVPCDSTQGSELTSPAPPTRGASTGNSMQSLGGASTGLGASGTGKIASCTAPHYARATATGAKTGTISASHSMCMEEEEGMLGSHNVANRSSSHDDAGYDGERGSSEDDDEVNDGNDDELFQMDVDDGDGDASGVDHRGKRGGRSQFSSPVAKAGAGGASAYQGGHSPTTAAMGDGHGSRSRSSSRSDSGGNSGGPSDGANKSLANPKQSHAATPPPTHDGSGSGRLLSSAGGNNPLNSTGDSSVGDHSPFSSSPFASGSGTWKDCSGQLSDNDLTATGSRMDEEEVETRPQGGISSAMGSAVGATRNSPVNTRSVTIGLGAVSGTGIGNMGAGSGSTIPRSMLPTRSRTVNDAQPAGGAGKISNVDKFFGYDGGLGSSGAVSNSGAVVGGGSISRIPSRTMPVPINTANLGTLSSPKKPTPQYQAQQQLMQQQHAASYSNALPTASIFATTAANNSNANAAPSSTRAFTGDGNVSMNGGGFNSANEGSPMGGIAGAGAAEHSSPFTLASSCPPPPIAPLLMQYHNNGPVDDLLYADDIDVLGSSSSHNHSPSPQGKQSVQAKQSQFQQSMLFADLSASSAAARSTSTTSALSAQFQAASERATSAGASDAMPTSSPLSSSSSSTNPPSFSDLVKRSTRFITSVPAIEVLMKVESLLAKCRAEKEVTPIGVIGKVSVNWNIYRLEVWSVSDTSGYPLCALQLYQLPDTGNTGNGGGGGKAAPSNILNCGNASYAASATANAASQAIGIMSGGVASPPSGGPNAPMYLVEFIRGQLEIFMFKRFYQWIRQQLVTELVKIKDYSCGYIDPPVGSPGVTSSSFSTRYTHLQQHYQQGAGDVSL